MAYSIGKRRFPRVSMAGRMEGHVRPTIEGSIIDLSLGGVCIEHRAIVQPGWVCDVTLRAGDGNILTLRARVVWVDLDRVEKQGQDRVLIYRAGFEFVEVTADQEALLQRILKASEADGPGGLRSLVVFLTFL